MASKFFERRSFRNQLKTYLELKGWVNLTWAEGFSAYTLPEIIPPFIVVFVDDYGKQTIEMGANPTINKMFNRRAQVTVFMETEDRVSALLDDIADFLDIEVILIKDNNTNIMGSMISDTATITTATAAPTSAEKVIEWQGSAACMYETFYPNG